MTTDGSLLRRHLRVDQSSDLAVVSVEKSQLTEATVATTEARSNEVSSVLSADDSVKTEEDKPSTTTYSVMLQKSTQGSKLMNVNKGKVVLMKANSEIKEQQTEDTKTKCGQVIYESVRRVYKTVRF